MKEKGESMWRGMNVPDREDVETRWRFLQWQAVDAQRLADAAPNVLGAVQARCVERIYRHLDRFDEPARLLSEIDRGRLEHSQQRYYERLWQGPYDPEYIQNRLQVGIVHQRIGLDVHWYMGTYRHYLSDMLDHWLGDHPQVGVLDSLLKVIFFDMTLAIDAYSAAQRKALQDSEARLARALRGTEDGLWDWDIETDRLHLSERWTAMLGLAPMPSGESDYWFARVHPEDLPGLRRAISAHLQGHTASLVYEYRLRTHSGDYLWVLVRGVAERLRDGGYRMAGSQTDISTRKAYESRLQDAARQDPLTGLANRLCLEELLQGAGRKPGRESALLFIDLDRFKLINDSLGHATGDQVLIEVATRLRNCLRLGDHLARFGGDEFVALLGGLTSLADAERVAQRMLDALRKPLQLGERTLVVTASIGIAPLQQGEQSTNPLQAADLALYQAKNAGKAQFALYSAELSSTASKELELASALAQALDRREFVLHYQPVCRLADGQVYVAGIEALLRWQHDGRLVAPGEFIPALEASREIVRVGEWVLREACRQVRQWQDEGQSGLYCAVNLSIRQLHEEDFSQCLARILEETGLPPTSLVLEITETLLMQDTEQVRTSLRQLAELGVRLALDDFGTGYCSLGYLKRVPLHFLKLDRSFIAGVPGDPDSTVISRAIIGLGQSLGLSVVAEGVESAEQQAFVAAEGCRYAQGYRFGQPLPAAELGQRFERTGHVDGLWGLRSLQAD